MVKGKGRAGAGITVAVETAIAKVALEVLATVIMVGGWQRSEQVKAHEQGTFPIQRETSQRHVQSHAYM